MKWKILEDRIFTVIIIIFSISSMVPLFLILFQILKNGLGTITWDLFTKLPEPPGEMGGGVLNSILGTLMLIILAGIFVIPMGILTGIYLSEVQNRFTGYIRILINILQGLPSIVVGIIAYIWVVKPIGAFSAISGGVALGLIMLPQVIKSTEESLKLLPVTLKEASYSLGVGYARTIIKVALPACFGGIASGVLLSISRIAGETAPLLFTAFGNPYLNVNPVMPVDALPLTIFNYAMSPYDSWHRIAWGASQVLIILILGLNILVRILGKRWKIRF